MHSSSFAICISLSRCSFSYSKFASCRRFSSVSRFAASRSASHDAASVKAALLSLFSCKRSEDTFRPEAFTAAPERKVSVRASSLAIKEDDV